MKEEENRDQQPQQGLLSGPRVKRLRLKMRSQMQSDFLRQLPLHSRQYYDDYFITLFHTFWYVFLSLLGYFPDLFRL